jgi:sugar lactone lactonase YvrE
MKRGGIFAALLAAGCMTVPNAAALADIPINGERIFPESITSDAQGNIYHGSNNGTIYRVLEGSPSSQPWILPSETNGLTSVFGVFADDNRGLLWACNNPGFGGPPKPGARSSLKSFDIVNGELIGSYDFPEGQAACNDIALRGLATTFATETSGGRIFKLEPGGTKLDLYAESPDLVGIDGIAFGDDGKMYINNVRKNTVQRVDQAADGSFAGLTTLTLSEPVNGPDGLRSIGGNRFLQAEGPGGRVALLEIEGDTVKVTPIKTGLESSPAVTRVGNIGYATEGKIGYLFDPALRDKDPGQFIIRSFPLPEGL